MKQIGYTEQHEPIIVCSGRELQWINELNRVASGLTINYGSMSFDRQLIEDDYAPFLEAVVEWITVKDRANALRQLAAQIESSIKVPPDARQDGAT